jgi:glucosamine 6-phosphate synthetase-like amidotransferase/phosphosugar isomerase protein
MCAIFGLGFMRGHEIRNDTLIQNFIRSLFSENMVRGRTASGMAYVSYRGIKVIKKDIYATGFINLPEYRKTESECVSFDISNTLLSVLGHCRLKTKGTETNNKNNHPIICNKVVGVHNGCISNDDELFTVYNGKINRNGEVDSEIIFSLVDYFSKTCHIHDAIQRMSSIVSGGLACAMVHELQPHVIWLFRRFNPCDIVLFKDIGLISWSSSKDYIESATSGLFGKGEIIQFPPNSGIGIDLHRNRIHRFTIEESKHYTMY